MALNHVESGTDEEDYNDGQNELITSRLDQKPQAFCPFDADEENGLLA